MNKQCMAPPRARPASILRTPLAMLMAACLVTPLAARAASHGLIMWIGSYAEPSVKLQGATADAELARAMARQLGVRQGNLIELHDQQLSLQGMRMAWSTLTERVKPGDEVFIYFSGHGAQRDKADGSGCSEGLVTFDGRVYFDVQLRQQLERLAMVAARVWMFNDACHAGGAVAKVLPFRDGVIDVPREASGQASAGAPQIKLYPLTPLADKAANARAGREEEGPMPPGGCGVPVNVLKGFGGLLGARGAQDKVLYIAAAADNEAAFGTEQGSAATRAWSACLQSGKAFTGDSLARCAQDWLGANLPQFRQTITVRLNGRMPLVGTVR